MTAFVLALVMAQVSGTLATVAQGSISGVVAPGEVVVRTAAEWASLWKTHAGTQPPPAVDFSTNMVTAVFLGTRPTAGYRVEILTTRIENDALIVEYVERTPDPGAIVAAVLTSPFHVVKLPRFNGPVRFRKTVTVNTP